MTGSTPEPPSLESIIRNRHSTRAFKQDPIPKTVVYECLTLAQRGAASNSNIQNWRLSIAIGTARDRVVAAMTLASETYEPQMPPLPPQFKHHRDDLVQQLYGSQGYDLLGDENREAREQARMRNFSFFGAPVVGVITMDDCLRDFDAMAVGLFVQSFILLLSARGVGSCLQVSVTGYPEVLRREFRLPEGSRVLCGIAIGWPSDERINSVVSAREPIERYVEFLES